MSMLKKMEINWGALMVIVFIIGLTISGFYSRPSDYEICKSSCWRAEFPLGHYDFECMKECNKSFGCKEAKK